ncbi:transcriptional regulator GlcC [Halomonas litopenaei]|uniref:Transcriptional regulator GlcC n=2 Tax=Halomonas TaxID=2745 RepID=A0AAU7KG94_9GAMM|nr:MULTISPECIES: transcriptional regulator GlcC [Halomonas]MBS8269364.1 transcriptional regulator GlcC [Halomonas litopenaei]MBY5943462.1 transcriptional regulator GlcC [Halomonas sp. DP5N14-9]MBY6110127.1 transcriptional regulator GlcC [Halomonas sp. DP1Y21-3]PTL91777.1 transcriptional regulator GlcC [Halomonas sp. SYSU XM8]PTL94813.1 transcriptional regulator GlcC [Halomonas litopenaei]|tara:strand:- start:29 stop:802 length:774 start_codon:yes stop_codon:yes gene_type:complete
MWDNEERLAPSSTSQAIASKLETLILDGVFRPGQLLPSERRLCERLGVGRSSLREALGSLRSKGVIVTRQGRGSEVAPLVEAPHATPLMHLFREHPRTLYDLLEVRALLEGESASLAASRGTASDRVLITRRYREMADYVEKADPLEVERLARLDHAFHLAICQASHNPVLAHTLQSLTDLLLSSVFASVKHLYHRPDARDMINRQHARLHRAVVEGKPQLARRVALEHLSTIGDMLREIEAEDQRLERSAMRLEEW